MLKFRVFHPTKVWPESKDCLQLSNICRHWNSHVTYFSFFHYHHLVKPDATKEHTSCTNGPRHAFICSLLKKPLDQPVAKNNKLLACKWCQTRPFLLGVKVARWPLPEDNHCEGAGKTNQKIISFMLLIDGKTQIWNKCLVWTVLTDFHRQHLLSQGGFIKTMEFYKYITMKYT